MRKLLLLLAFSLIPIAGLKAPISRAIVVPVGLKIRPLEPLWRAVCTVESNNDPMAYNPSELAVGIVQIRPIRLQDYNKRTHKSYRLKDCYNPKISKEIWLYYATKYHYSDYETIARAWNGKGKLTIRYWGRIKSELLKQK